MYQEIFFKGYSDVVYEFRFIDVYRPWFQTFLVSMAVVTTGDSAKSVS